MRKYVQILIIFILFTSGASAAGVYLTSKGHFSEMVLAGVAGSVVSVSRGENMLAIELTKPVTGIKGSRIHDPFFKALSVNGKILTISLYPGSDYTISDKKDNLHIIAAKTKKTDELKPGYGIEQPVATSDMTMFENKDYEAVLARIDSLMNSGDFTQALNTTEGFMKNLGEGYYKQEAYFRLGMIYLRTGKNNYANYVFAGQIFDDFIKKYPESFRKKDAMIKLAESKEMSQMYNEAIFAYNNVIKTLRSPDVVKTAYERIANIYEQMGQPKSAIETREQIIKRFRDTYADQKAKIGILQAKMKDYDLAYSSFLSVANSEPDYDKMNSEQLYTMADIFDIKSQTQLAQNFYEKVYGLYPSGQQADMAIYKSALMLDKQGQDKAADARLQMCSKTYPKKRGGLLCSVKFASKHIKKKTSAEWEEYLRPATTSQDIDIRSDAELIVIRALMAENNFDAAAEKVNAFIKKNFSSPRLDDVYKIMQQLTLRKAREAYKRSDYAAAKSITEKMLQEYPDTPYRKEALEILQDISFGDIRDMYKAGKYKDTVNALTAYLSENTDLINPEKWMNMLQEAKFAYTKQVYNSKNYRGTIVTANEYNISFPAGAHKAEVRKMLEASISNVITGLYKKQAYIELVDIFDKNSSTIITSTDNNFKDRMNSYTAFALYKLGMADKAAKILDRTKSSNNPYYTLTSLMLGREMPNADPNKFNNTMMNELVQELEKKNPDRLVDLLQKYKKDPAYAAKVIYSISKGVFDDIKREKMLFDLYMKVDMEPKARFKGYDEIYLDTGISFFKRNNFDSAAKVLEQFKLVHTQRDDKRAEGLYYLGKTYAKMGKKENSDNAYMELLESVPKSVYASAAKSELEDAKWRKNLKK